MLSQLQRINIRVMTLIKKLRIRKVRRLDLSSAKSILIGNLTQTSIGMIILHIIVTALLAQPRQVGDIMIQIL